MSLPYADYHSAGDGADSFSYRRLPSSDYEEMMSFSSLPTSHFTLRPSSSDVDSGKPPMQYWQQPPLGYMQTDSESWSWNLPTEKFASNERKHWPRRVVNKTSLTHPYPPPPPSAPSNYASNLFHGTRSYPIKQNSTTQQQVAPDQDKPAQADRKDDRKDVSRSSLSVTNSKTIVLTNPPTSWQDKKKEVDRLLNQQQQNHRLPSSSSNVKSRVTPPSEGGRESKKCDGVGEGVKGSGDHTTPRGVASSEGELKGAASEEKTVRKLEKTGDGSDRKEQTKSDKTPSASSVAATATKDAEPSAGVSDAPSLPTKSSSKDSDPPVEEKKTVGNEKSPEVVDVWSMRGPANGLLSLNVRTGARKRDRVEPGKPLKGTESVSVESAHLITSQFASKTVKKEEGGATEVLQPPTSLGGILLRATGNRSGSSTPTILGSADMITQQKLASMVTSLGKLPIELTPTTPPVQQENTPFLGSEVKRTKSVSDRVGAAGHVILSQPSAGGVAHHPTVSTGTNGTSIQDIFNSTKRKLSESKGQGLKQALAG